MMADKTNYNDLLYAYALGCLDTGDMEKVREIYETGDEQFYAALGEFQNLAALLPSILNIEAPSPQLKDKVARKLYRIKEEIKMKRTGELKESRPTFTPPPPPVTSPSSVEKDAANEPEDILEPNEEMPDYTELTDTEKFTFDFDEPSEEQKEEAAEKETEEQVEEDSPQIYEEEKYGEELGFDVIDEEPRTDEINETEPEQQTEEEIDEKPLPDEQIKDAEDVSPEEEVPENDYHSKYETQIRERNKSKKFTRVDEINLEKEDDIFLEEETGEQPDVSTPLKAGRTTREKMEPRYAEHPAYAEPEIPHKRSNPLFIVGVIILALLIIAAGIYAYFTISTEVGAYKTEIQNLKTQVSELSSKYANKQDIQKLLESPNVKIATLQSTQLARSGFGKIILEPGNGRGYLQMGNMPELPEGKAYQLWMNPAGLYISLGVFNASQGTEYFPFKSPVITEEKAIKFLITEEPSTGSKRPGNQVVLTGQID